jgi:hypothetical protein
MKKLLRDPELEALVRELNEGGGSGEPGVAGAGAAPSTAPDLDRADTRSASREERVTGGDQLESLLIEVAQRGASDLLLVAGTPPVFRVGGRLTRASEDALSTDDVHALLAGAR